MFRLGILLTCLLPFGGVAVTSVAGADDPKASVEKLVNAYLRAYCAEHSLTRDKVEPWKSALAPEGRVFRYKLATVSAKEKQEALRERYAFVFVDPDTGNVYDVKRTPGGDKNLNQRTLAILRLMGTKVANSKHAEAVMADLFRIHNWLGSADDRDHVVTGPVTVRMVQILKGESGIEPPTYIAETSKGLRLVMTVDEDGYATDFRIQNIR